MWLGSGLPFRLLKKKKAIAAKPASPATPPTTPPAMAPTLVCVPPELFPPPEPSLEVEEGGRVVPVPGVGVFVTPVGGLGVEDVSVELGMETTDGALGVASGSLPAAFAIVTSNVLV